MKLQQRVWLYDGHIAFLRGKHLPLFITSLFFLVFLFLPYTLLLLFGQFLRILPRKRGLGCLHSSFFTSIMDTYHAPYTKGHRYWTGLGLLIRCCLFTIFATSYSVHLNMLWILLALIFMLTIRHVSVVYQKKVADWLEVVFLVNLGVLSSFLLYNNKACVVITLSASFSLCVFMFIIAYHLHQNRCKISKERLGKVVQLKTAKTHSSVKNS